MNARVLVLGFFCACGSTPATNDAGSDAGAGIDVVTNDVAADTSSDAPSSCGYDAVVLADQPVAFWAMSHTTTEPDLTGHGHDGTYKGGAPAPATMPDGCDQAADFDGAKQYMTVPSSAALSIPTTGDLTWEGWIRPDVLQFPNNSGDYVDWMGKCEQYSPTCEWEARMYTTTNSANRPNRFSVYAFNPTAKLGSGADWQPATGVVQAGHWYHVVGEYTLHSQPSVCQNTSTYPGSLNVWVNGIPWDQSVHGQTGCMSQYSVIPKASGSAVNIGTMAFDSWFAGAIGKVAIYDKLLTQAQITAHYEAMTNASPTGSCADTCSF